jgi:hypothetical protein
MDLGSLIYDGSASSLSLVGMAKNVGKTVALQYLLSQQSRFSRPIGVTSMGRDGEEEDAYSGAEKPRIWLTEGMLVASAAQLLVKSPAKLKILESTGLDCALGPIYLAKVTGAGYGELAGPPAEEKLKKLVALMHAFGASLVFVDGAFDRQISASPAVTESALLATGLALNPDPQAVVAKTAGRVEQLTIPPLTAELKGALKNLDRDIGVALVQEDGEALFLPIPSALGNETAILKALQEGHGARALLILGAVVDATLESLMENREMFKGMPVVIKNGACLFVQERVWKRFQRSGISLMALNSIRVAAVTVNPTSPGGREVFAAPFIREMSRQLPGLPVFDLVARLGAWEGELI